MPEKTLFELPEKQASELPAPTRPEDARVLRPIRNQNEWMPRSLDATLPDDHQACAIWVFLEKLDLSAFYVAIKAVLDGPGRSTTDPQVLLALWLLATADGIGSARQLARLCEEHDAYYRRGLSRRLQQSVLRRHPSTLRPEPTVWSV